MNNGRDESEAQRSSESPPSSSSLAANATSDKTKPTSAVPFLTTAGEAGCLLRKRFRNSGGGGGKRTLDLTGYSGSSSAAARSAAGDLSFELSRSGGKSGKISSAIGERYHGGPIWPKSCGI